MLVPGSAEGTVLDITAASRLARNEALKFVATAPPRAQAYGRNGRNGRHGHADLAAAAQRFRVAIHCYDDVASDRYVTWRNLTGSVAGNENCGTPSEDGGEGAGAEGGEGAGVHCHLHASASISHQTPETRAD